MSKTCEEIYVDKATSGIRGIKLGTKTVKEADVSKWLNKLKPLNDGLHADLSMKFIKAVAELAKKKSK